MPDDVAEKPEEAQVTEDAEFEAAFNEFAAPPEPDPDDSDDPIISDEIKDGEDKAKKAEEEGAGASSEEGAGDADDAAAVAAAGRPSRSRRPSRRA